MTPLIVTWLDPAVIVPVRVPPSVPVPVLRLSVTAVALATAVAAPALSWAATTTEKLTPAVGLVPPLTEVIASLVAVLTQRVASAAA